MTLATSAWAIDGAIMSSASARQALYASIPGGEGIVGASDLKVSQLSTPGVGVQISPGVGVVLNRYQSTINESYVVSNPTVHIVPSGQMPASNPSAKAYILAIVVGDPQFAQVGHPWMLASDPPAGEEATFEYVRATLIEVGATATTIPGATYPYLALARINVPANTTTITNSMITDLTDLGNPRSWQRLFAAPDGAYGTPNYIPAGSSYGNWSWIGTNGYRPQVPVPSWAKRAIVSGRLTGVGLSSNGGGYTGGVRFQIGSLIGGVTRFDTPNSTGAIRLNLECASDFDISSLAGTTADILIEGYQDLPASPTTAQRLRIDGGSQVVFDVRFFEE